MSTTPDPGCVFCALNPRRLWQRQGLAICSDPAPLETGHLLIYTTDHYPSSADMDVGTATQLDQVESAVGKRIATEYGDYMLFEHGRTGHCLRSRPGERLCHHMHVHMIPGHMDLRALAAIGHVTEVSSWHEILALGRETDGYVVTGTASGKAFIPVTRPLPPHYLRTVIAEANGTPHRADWEIALAGKEVEAVAAASHAVVAKLVEGIESGGLW